MANTTWKSRTGAVISVSSVPIFDSSAKTRIVISGKTSTSGIQKYTVLKNASTIVVVPELWFSSETPAWKLKPVTTRKKHITT